MQLGSNASWRSTVSSSSDSPFKLSRPESRRPRRRDDRFWAVVESIEVFPDMVFVTLDYLGVRRHHQRWSPFPNTWEFPRMKRTRRVIQPVTLNPRDDGVTHINVYSRGRTQLGRLLSNFAETPFIHPRHGRFDSIEGLWYWLSVDPTNPDRDSLRKLSGFAAKKVGRKLRGNDWPDSDQFMRDVKLGLYSKLMFHREVRSQLLESKLPLVHYYVAWGKVFDVSDQDWTHKWFASYRSMFKGSTFRRLKRNASKRRRLVSR